jgi:hypothetical protein
MFGEPRVEANLDDPRRRVADALATFTIEDLRQLVAEIKAPVDWRIQRVRALEKLRQR